MADDQIDVLGQPPLFDPTEGPNGDVNIAYDANDNIDYIDKIVNGITYRKNFTWAAGTVSGFILTDIEPWIKQ
jgi:hypothetical protein